MVEAKFVCAKLGICKDLNRNQSGARNIGKVGAVKKIV